MTVMESVVRQTQSAPSPLVGEGWGGGSSLLHAFLSANCHPHPQPLPTRGRGTHHLCGWTDSLRLIHPGMTCSKPHAARNTKTVIAGLDPAIHLPSRKLLAKMMDARVKPAHDGGERRPNPLDKPHAARASIAALSSAS